MPAPPVSLVSPVSSFSGACGGRVMASTSSSRVELLLGELAVGDVAAFDDDLADGLALRERLLGDARRLLVAEVAG